MRQSRLYIGNWRASPQTSLGSTSLRLALKNCARRIIEWNLADVTRPGLAQQLTDTYDLVTAGEIIEHLLDLSVFFANVKDVLTPNGRVVISTPNAQSLHLYWQRLIGRPVDNVDHVILHFPSGMVEIAERCGFEVLEIRGERRLFRRSIFSFFLGRVLSLLWRDANAECITVIYVLGLAEPAPGPAGATS